MATRSDSPLTLVRADPRRRGRPAAERRRAGAVARRGGGGGGRARPTPRRLARALAGDLDTIVGAAVRKDAARRYSGVGPLVDDVQRHLAREPVQARGAHAGYAIARFVQRHWLLAGVSTLAILGVAAGALVAERHARRADRRFQEVRRLARALIFDLDQRIAPLPGSTPARQYAVATSLSYLDGLLLEADGDPGLLLELAEAYERVADVQGHPRSAEPGTAAGGAAQLRARPAAARPHRGARPDGRWRGPGPPADAPGGRARGRRAVWPRRGRALEAAAEALRALRERPARRRRRLLIRRR